MTQFSLENGTWRVVFLALNCVLTALGAVVTLPVYDQTATIVDYIYYDPLPEMTSFTMCFWMKYMTTDRSSDHTISIAVPSYDNELLMIWGGTDYATYKAHFSGTTYSMPACEVNELNNLLTNWNKHCYTWTSNGNFKWYATLNDHSNLELYRQVATGVKTIRTGGALVLFQEQDSYLGGFSLSQGAVAKAAWFNVWDYEMTSQEVNALNCHDEGNVLEFTSMKFGGAAHFDYDEQFECGPNDRVPLTKTYGTQRQGITMCKIDGAKLSNHVISSVTTPSAAACVLKCAAEESCMSVNYKTDTSSCDLNNVEGRSYAGISGYNDQLDGTNLYFSAEEC